MKLGASVLGATVCGGVVTDRLVRTEAGGLEASALDALRDERARDDIAAEPSARLRQGRNDMCAHCTTRELREGLRSARVSSELAHERAQPFDGGDRVVRRLRGLFFVGHFESWLANGRGDSPAALPQEFAGCEAPGSSPVDTPHDATRRPHDRDALQPGLERHEACRHEEAVLR